MKVLQLVSAVDEEADGVASVVIGLTEKMISSGYDVNMICAEPHVDKKLPPGTLVVKSQKFIKWDINLELMLRLKKLSNDFDIIHNHGLWNPVNIAAGFMVPGKRSKLVTSPHGTLTEWALNYSKRKKQILWIAQKRVLESADLIHVTSESELEDVRRVGIKKPVAIIPIGIDLPNKIEEKTSKHHRTLLFLSRIHEIKGIENLLLTWANIQESVPDWRLVIAGKGSDDYVRNIQRFASRIGVKRVEFSGPKYGMDKYDTYINADLFILPTYSENFGIVVAEALASGCPAIVGKGAPWEGLRQQHCGWWVDNSVAELTITLTTALNMDSATLQTMGEAGRQWMLRDFSWESMIQKMNSSYEWVLGKCSKPEWIITD